MTKRSIKKVAVIGSGIMGSGIACHFANIGLDVLLLDISPKTLNDNEKRKKLNLNHKSVKNRIVNDSLSLALASQPSPMYHSAFETRITTGNLEDDIAKIKHVDWIIEAVVERLDTKQQVLEMLDKHRSLGTLVSSNTSGIPIAFLAKGRSEDFKTHFCGTHFFNPVRYLKLLEIIPGPKTHKSVIRFLSNYGEHYLGKTTVIAKDTPAFIANRIGVFSMMSLLHITKDIGLTIPEVDVLTGSLLGRPKSATFRTADLVGLDTLVHVANGIKENCDADQQQEVFNLPEFMSVMLKNKWLGQKTKQGFYKKTISNQGKKEILSLNLNTLVYEKPKPLIFKFLKDVNETDTLTNRFKLLLGQTGKVGDFYKRSFAALFTYVSYRVSEISDKLYHIDDAMRAGFGWEQGPFQIWDAIGVKEGFRLMQAQKLQPALWVTEMLATGIDSFYTTKNGLIYVYDVHKKTIEKRAGQDAFIILDSIRKTTQVYQNSGVVIEDLGDGILNLEFRSKMNTIGGEVLEGLNKAIDLAEKNYQGLVIANQASNFSVGANIEMVFKMASEKEYVALNDAIKYFQDSMMRVRYSSIPTVVAPYGMTLGGGCELSMHADSIVAAAETYIGLVEFAVGLIPAGGGTKEMILRASNTFKKGDVQLNVLQDYFLTIAMAKVANSAYEAFDLGFFQKGRDTIVVNNDRQITVAKAKAKFIAELGYTQPLKRNDIKVLGKQALAMFLVGTDSMSASRYISDHDKKIANKLAYVMAGGDLSEPTLVSEQYLLDLERDMFLSLCKEQKTLERIKHMLQTGKPLRN